MMLSSLFGRLVLVVTGATLTGIWYHAAVSEIVLVTSQPFWQAAMSPRGLLVALRSICLIATVCLVAYFAQMLVRDDR